MVCGRARPAHHRAGAAAAEAARAAADAERRGGARERRVRRVPQGLGQDWTDLPPLPHRGRAQRLRRRTLHLPPPAQGRLRRGSCARCRRRGGGALQCDRSLHGRGAGAAGAQAAVTRARWRARAAAGRAVARALRGERIGARGDLAAQARGPLRARAVDGAAGSPLAARRAHVVHHHDAPRAHASGGAAAARSGEACTCRRVGGGRAHRRVRRLAR